jgi:D-alanyl-D-alanine carboxypeptidase (penicillin-binding protein 5/6)
MSGDAITGGMKHLNWLLVACLAAPAVWAASPAPRSGRALIGDRSAKPYLGAIVADPVSGTIFFEERADEPGYPASVVKLMDLLLIEERIEAGLLSLTNQVRVTAEAAGIGGSQVYLAENEVFPLEELLAAMTIHSANDAAVALALHVAGSRSAFVDLMNKRAAELGMTSTRFHSVHGLPPAEGQEPDVSTARDLAILAREVLRHPDILRYTSVQNRPFRNGAFNLRNPDKLIGDYPGCDGLKTGYFRLGGFSIVSTAQRNGRRVIAVVLGSTDKDVRNAAAADLMSKGFLGLEKIPLPPPPPVVVTNAVPVPEPVKPVSHGPRLRLLLVAGVGVAALIMGFVVWRNRLPRQ